MLRFWRSDLVEERIRWRVRILGVVLAYSVLAAAAGIPSPAAASVPWMGLADAAALCAVGAAVATSLLGLRPGLWLLAGPAQAAVAPADTVVQPVAGLRQSEEAHSSRQPDGPAVESRLPAPPAARPETAETPQTAETAETAEDPATLSRLQRAMQQDQIYRREGLTIGALAAHLGVPEYRLRRVINGQLGQRNFNVYLNAHRIAWARQALADPARAGEPVLTLALEAGFQSLGPFNRAFKADTGLTPTEFRARSLADSR